MRRRRRATSTSRAAPAVMAALSAVCANEKTDALVDMRFYSSFLSCIASLHLGRFAGELRIERVIEQPASLQRDPVIGTDAADALTEHVQTGGRGL